MELHIATYMIEVSPVMSVTPRINQVSKIFHGNASLVASPSARLALGYFTCSSSRLGNTRGIPQLANTETSEYWGTEYLTVAVNHIQACQRCQGISEHIEKSWALAMISAGQLGDCPGIRWKAWDRPSLGGRRCRHRSRHRYLFVSKKCLN